MRLSRQGPIGRVKSFVIALGSAMVLIGLLNPTPANASEELGAFLGAMDTEHPGWFKESFLDFEEDIEEDAIQRSQSLWVGESNNSVGPRIACQAILNSNDNRRLHWAVIPEGCVLSNSVNFLEFSEEVSEAILNRGGGSLILGLEWLCKVMNSEDLEIWSRAWGANNNVNNYEIESLPFPVPEDELAFSI